MSRRPRTTERRNVEPAVMEEARKLLADGKSQRSVAEILGMAESTLRKRLKKDTLPQTLGRFKCTFNLEMEAELLEYVKTLDSMFFGITVKDFRKLAFAFADKNNITHQFNKVTKMAGKDWYKGFMRKHTTLSLRQPTSTSVARAMGFNKPQVQRFYENLAEVIDKHHFPPHNIYNMDESGFSTVANKPPKVISTKGKRCVNKISSAERGQNVTVVGAMSASGHFIPPAFIFKRKRMRAELMDGAPPSSIGMVSDTSFINSDLFLDWLSHFKYHAKPTKEQPILLILDNHSTHCTLGAVDFCRENNIILLSLPPHSSHRIQPLDRCFFSPLKTYYAAECENWLRNHPGRVITTFQIASIFAPAYARAATVANAVKGFEVTGICPFNNNLFIDADFMASSVTERPLEAFENETEGPLATDRELPEFQIMADSMPISIEQLPSERAERRFLPIELDLLERAKILTGVRKDLQHKTVTVATSTEVILKNPFESPDPSTSYVNVKVTSLSPYPKSTTIRSSCKRRKKSEILSSSPYKRILEEEEIVKKEKETKKKVKEASKKGVMQPVLKKPRVAPKKKNWKCAGCSTIYIEPISEDWIACSACSEWWHERCTNYSGRGVYTCDLCT